MTDIIEIQIEAVEGMSDASAFCPAVEVPTSNEYARYEHSDRVFITLTNVKCSVMNWLHLIEVYLAGEICHIRIDNLSTSYRSPPVLINSMESIGNGLVDLSLVHDRKHGKAEAPQLQVMENG